MRSLLKMSVGNGWYWLLGFLLLYPATFVWGMIYLVYPAVKWHLDHPRKFTYDIFQVEVPLLWTAPKADFQSPDDISIEKAYFPGKFPSGVILFKSRPGDHSHWIENELRMGKPLFGPSGATRTTYKLTAGSMDCIRWENGLVINLSCVDERTGSSLHFTGSLSDFQHLPEIVR